MAQKDVAIALIQNRDSALPGYLYVSPGGCSLAESLVLSYDGWSAMVSARDGGVCDGSGDCHIKDLTLCR